MPTRPAYHQSTHQPARAEDRPNAHARGYDAAWRKLRAAFLSEFTFCVFCNDFAVLVDHIIPVVVNPALRLIRSNLRSCCTDCHAKLTTNFKLTGINEMPGHSQPQTRQTSTMNDFRVGHLVSQG